MSDLVRGYVMSNRVHYGLILYALARCELSFSQIILLCELLGVKKRKSVESWLRYQVKRGLVVKVGRGLYRISPDVEVDIEACRQALARFSTDLTKVELFLGLVSTGRVDYVYMLQGYPQYVDLFRRLIDTFQDKITDLERLLKLYEEFGSRLFKLVRLLDRVHELEAENRQLKRELRELYTQRAELRGQVEKLTREIEQLRQELTHVVHDLEVVTVRAPKIVAEVLDIVKKHVQPEKLREIVQELKARDLVKIISR